jgi:hypothetical protein
MPSVRKLSQEEVQAIEYKGKGVRKIIEEQYDEFLSEYQAGDYGEAELEPDEKRLTVRNRLKAAANRRNLSLQFNRTTGNTLRFKVTVASNTNSYTDISGNDGAVTKRRSGRPRKMHY